MGEPTAHEGVGLHLAELSQGGRRRDMYAMLTIMPVRSSVRVDMFVWHTAEGGRKGQEGSEKVSEMTNRRPTLRWGCIALMLSLLSSREQADGSKNDMW